MAPIFARFKTSSRLMWRIGLWRVALVAIPLMKRWRSQEHFDAPRLLHLLGLHHLCGSSPFQPATLMLIRMSAQGWCDRADDALAAGSRSLPVKWA